MGWFVVSAVAGFLMFVGRSVVENILGENISQWLENKYPTLAFIVGFLILSFLIVSNWVDLDLPRVTESKALERLAVKLHSSLDIGGGQIAQVIIGFVVGIAAGMIFEHLKQNVLGESGQVARVHHIWLGGALLFLIFLGVFAPHVRTILSNIQSFETTLFKFEVKSRAPFQRIKYLERRGMALGDISLEHAEYIPSIIKSDLEYLKHVVLRPLEEWVSENPISSNQFSHIKIGRQKNNVDKIRNQIDKFRESKYYIEKLISPIARCARAALSRNVDIELIRSLIREPINDLRVISQSPPSFAHFSMYHRTFVKKINRSLDKLANYVEERKKCNPVEYISEDLLDLNIINQIKSAPYIHLVSAYLDTFAKNFGAANFTLVRGGLERHGELNSSFFYSLLMFYSSADVVNYGHILERQISRIEEKKLNAQDACVKSYKCKEQELDIINDLIARYSRARIILMNAYVFAVTVDIAEGKKSAEGLWPTANSYVRILSKKLRELKENNDRKYRSFQDTVSFFNIIKEARQAIPNRKIISSEIRNLEDLESILQSEVRQFRSNPLEHREVLRELVLVRSHLELARSIGSIVGL